MSPEMDAEISQKCPRRQRLRAQAHCTGTSCYGRRQHQGPEPSRVQVHRGADSSQAYPAVEGHSAQLLALGEPQCWDSSFPSLPSHTEALFCSPSTQMSTQCLPVLPHGHTLSLVWLGAPPALSQIFPWEGVTSFSLDFFSLLASPSLSFNG